MIDSSIISESYFKSKKLYKLEFQIPPASEVWSLFDSDTVSDINKDIEEGLLESIDSLFKEGRFIMLFDWYRDEELCLDIEDAYLEFVNDKKPSKLLGQWRYVRSAREVTLEWDVPDWFVNSESQCIVDLDEIRNTVKDWFIYSE
jgi:hypothetical protein